MSLKNRAKDGPIKWPAMNLTLASGATLSIGALLTLWHDSFETIFGYKPEDHPETAAAIFISFVLAIALIYAADLLARGIASSKTGDSAALPKGLKATLIKPGEDERGYSAAAIRVSAAGPEVLIVKADQAAEWRQLGGEEGMVTLISP
ncbi:MAG TPA: hypothetical protein VGV69_02110 [Solirubrobacterales bacterium]|nr:hypothetical protein [Solirubrobacterales bacterium]